MARPALQGIVTAATLAATLTVALPSSAHALSGSTSAAIRPAALQSAPGTTGAFSPLPPTRLVDTRLGQGAPAGKVVPGETIRFQVAGVGGVPSDASAVALNLTIVDAARPGYASLWSTPNGASSPAGNPTTSSVNVGSAGATVANMSVIAPSTDGSLNLFSDAGGYVLVDLAGYWTPATQSSAGRYNAITPLRTLDTRGNARLSAEGTTEATVTGLAGIPADAAAVAVTITGTGAARAGFVTAWPSGMGRPTASNLNLPAAGSTVPNLAIVPVGAGGKISLYSSGGTDVIVDITGWFTGASAPSSSLGLFVPLPVTRTVDSRSLLGMRRLSPDLSSEMPAAGLGGVPVAGVAAVAVNLTVTGTRDDGFLTASPAGVIVPNASNLNFGRGRDVAGLSFAGLGADGKINLTSVSATNIIADVSGYFTGTPIPDQGIHPMACEDMMSVWPRPWDKVYIRDRTGAHADIVMDLHGGYGQLTENCDYFGIGYSSSETGESRMDRYSFTGRLMGTATFGPYLSASLSPDSRYLFTAEDFERPTRIYDGNNARYIYRTDVYTGERTQVYDAGARTIQGIDSVGPTGRLLHITAGSSDKGFVETLLNLDTKRSVPVIMGPNPHWVSQSPNGLLLTVGEIRLGTSGDNGGIVTCFNNTPSMTTCHAVEGVWSTFTPQNELMVIDRDGRALLYNLLTQDGQYQYDGGTPIPLDPVVDGYPFFPTYALV
jgi:hypothetical protein